MSSSLVVALLGALLGIVAGGLASFLAAVALQLLKGIRNAILARRGAGLPKDMIMVPLYRPGALLGALLGGASAPWLGYAGAAVVAGAPWLALIVLAAPGTLWVAATSAPLGEPELRSAEAPSTGRTDTASS